MVVSAWTIAVVLALAGLGLAWRGAIGRRVAAHSCPKCAYDLRGAPARVCPECGMEVASEDSPRRVRRWWLTPIGLAMLAPGMMLALPRRTATAIEWMLPASVRTTDRTLGNVRVRTFAPFELPSAISGALSRLRIHVMPGWEQRVEVTQGSRLVYSHSDRSVELGCAPFHGSAKIGVNEDLDGDDVPDLVITSYSGGAHCCWTYTFMRLGDRPAVVAELEAENGASMETRRTTSGASECIVTATDSIWNYWKTCYACSPRPTVVLRFSRAGLTPAPDLMLRPLPPAKELDEALSRARAAVLKLAEPREQAESSGVEVSDLWRMPLELLYTGHEPEAWAFFERAWPADGPGKDEFLREFRENLAKSPYWSQIHAAFAPR